MVHTWKAFRAPPARHIALHSRHKGFCRLAMEQRAHLVPVLALGETLQLRNLWDMPALQQFTYKRFGFPIPYMMAGRWGVSPLPRQVPLVYVVGEAIEPPALGEGGVVEQAALDELHAKYFNSLQALFDKYKGRHSEYKDAQMVLVD
jgi:2-acylglycerol O-acyltransferase 2